MKLSIRHMSKSDTIESTLWFQTDDSTQYWREPLFICYPILDKKLGLSAPWSERKKYLETKLGEIYQDNQIELSKKSQEFQKVWDEKQSEVTRIFSKIFGIDCAKILNNMWAEVSLNPICPRFLDARGFTVYWKGDADGFMATAIHEIIHFVWFDIWQKYFNDDVSEYNQPHLKWLLSEMVVRAIITNSELVKFFTEKELENSVYSYFYQMIVKGKPILDTLSEFYKKSNSITEFMEIAYEFCRVNEREIKAQVK